MTVAAPGHRAADAVLSGVLVETGLLDVVVGLAGGSATGCLHVATPSGDTARLYLRSGGAYAWDGPGDAAAGPLPALLADLLRRREGSWRFRLHERAAADAGEQVRLVDVLADLTADLPPAGAVPQLSAGAAAGAELDVDGDPWPLLSRVDGRRTVAQLASDCGLTTWSAARLVAALAVAGVLQVDRAAHVPAGTVRAVVPLPRPELETWPELQRVRAAATRVAGVLAELLGPPRELDDAFRHPVLQAGPAAAPAPPAPDVEAERLESERLESERLESERLESERLESERLESERLESERAEAERAEAERAEAEQERAEQERAEQERAEQERAERETARPDAAALAAFASELTATANSAPSAVPPAPEPEPEPESAPVVPPRAEEPPPRTDTDTAALLRELTSLGLEDAPAPTPAPRATPPAQPPVGVGAQARKKKGLFGR